MASSTEHKASEAGAAPVRPRSSRFRLVVGMAGGVTLLSAVIAAPSVAARASDDSPEAATELIAVSPAISAIDSTVGFGGNLAVGLGSAILFSQLAGIPIPGLDAASADLAAAAAQGQGQGVTALHGIFLASGEAVAPLGSGVNPVAGPPARATVDALSEAGGAGVAIDQLASNVYPSFNAGGFFGPYLSSTFDGFAKFFRVPEEAPPAES